jgi:hypothetical protein
MMAAINYFKNLNHMSEYAQAKGTPFPDPPMSLGSH